MKNLILDIKRRIATIPFIGRMRRRRLIKGYTGSPLYNYLENVERTNVLAGSWHEIGSASGRLARQASAMGLAPDFIHSSRLSGGSAFKKANNLLEHALKAAPWMRDMIQGFSDGSNLSFEQVLLDQFITGLGPQEAGRSCGALAWKKNTNGCILGQVLDLGLSWPTCTSIVKPDTAIPFVAHMNVGTLWFGTGINKCGVFCGGASVNGRKETNGESPFFLHPFICLMILTQAQSASQAISLIKDLRPFGGAGDAGAMLIGDNSQLYRVEISGCRVESKLVEKDVVTNHFVLGDMPKLEASGWFEKTARRLSETRYLKGKEFLEKEKSSDPKCLIDFLQASGNIPDWCRTGVCPDEGWTTARHIIDTEQGHFYSWHGPGMHNLPVCFTKIREVLD